MQGDRFDVPVCSGTYGNAAVHDSSVTFAGEAAGEIVAMLPLPAGTRVTGLKLISEGLGASSTLKAGYRYVNPDNGATSDAYFLPAASSATAGARESAAFPIEFNRPVEIIVTTGGAAVTGKVCVIPEYAYIGNL